MEDQLLMSAKESRNQQSNLDDLIKKAMWLIKNRYLEPDPNYISQILQELINKASLQHKKKLSLIMKNIEQC